MTEVDFDLVRLRMSELEERLAQMPGDPDEVETLTVMARLLEVEDEKALEKAVLEELKRVRVLVFSHYGPAMKTREPGAAFAAVGFLQGLQFARAVAEVRRDT